MINFSTIGRRINQYRKKGGLTQSHVAELLGVSTNYISQIERGSAKVSLTRLDEIANIINTDIENLISGIDDASPQYLNSEIYRLTKDWEPCKKNLLLKIVIAIDEE